MQADERGRRAISGMDALFLGQATLRVSGKPLPLMTRKALALVAYLALEGATERSRLSDLLWTDLDRASGRGNLRRELYRLHPTPLWAMLDRGADRLGFHTELPTDVVTFEEHITAGRLAEALLLYRGPLLRGLDLQGAEGFEEWLTERRQRLEDTYHAALAQHARALETAGDLRGALVAQLDLLRADELQERAYREAMRLHALLGERGLALLCYKNLQEVLARELGLIPLPETTALAERIRAEAVPAVQLDGAGQTPLLAPPLVGRAGAWDVLTRSPAALCLIVAEAGVGKTRLAEDFARSRGQRVLVRGLEAASDTPLSALADALRGASQDGAVRARLKQLDLVWQREAAWLVPELGPEAVSARPPSPEGRARFLEGLARTLAAAVGPGGTIIFDDFQWCDPSTVEAAFHLTRLSSSGDFRIIATARPAELNSHPAALRTLASLEREGQLQRLELEPLSDLDVLMLVRSMSGGSGALLFSQRLHEATGGNPLYLLETLRALFASGLLHAGEGGWSTPFDEATSDYAELPLPPSVSEAVLRRVNLLGGGARRLLELASLAGNGFHLARLAGASALTEWEQLEGLERALEAYLIVPHKEGYRFSHELVRRALERSIGPERRRLSHRKLAENLIRAGEAPGQIAAHLERAGQLPEAVAYRVRAAQAAARVFAQQEALDEYTYALRDGANGTEAFEVYLARAELLVTTGDYVAAQGELNLAAPLTAQPDGPEQKARLDLAQAGLHNVLGHYAEALDLTTGLLNLALPTRLEAQALFEHGSALLRLGRLGEAEPCLQSALTRVPDDAPELAGHLNTHLQACAMQRGDLNLAQRHNAAALSAFLQAGSRTGLVKTRGSAGLLVGLLGDARAAAHLLEEVLNEARDIGDVSIQRTLLLNLFKFLLDSGDLEAAVPRLEEGLALARSPQDPYLEGIFLNNLGVVQRLRGDMGAAITAFSAALDLADRTGIAQHQVRRRITLAEQHLDLGDPSGARPLLEAARHLAAPKGLGEIQAWLETLCARCDLLSGAPAAALPRLNALLGAENIDAEDRVRITWMLGQTQLALGAPQAALLHMAELDLPVNPLLRSWALSLRLEARTHLHLSSAEDLVTAGEFLASNQVLPLESLGLYAAVVHALQAVGEEKRALSYYHNVQMRVQNLAASLKEFPQLQQSLLSRYQPSDQGTLGASPV